MSVDPATARYFVYIACADLECMASQWHEYLPIHRPCTLQSQSAAVDCGDCGT